MEPGAQEHDTQRALIFQGGGALGAYEAGVFKALCELLPKKDGKLFDIVAGTSAGAINSCLIVNHVVNTGDWHDAANVLYKFWRETASHTYTSFWPKSNLVSQTWSYLEDLRQWQVNAAKTIADSALIHPIASLRERPLLLPLYFFWPDNLGSFASEEATRRYRSWNIFALAPFGTPNVLSPAIFQPDFAFFNPLNFLLRYSNEPLVKTIRKYWDFEKGPIKTYYEQGQPRLMFVSVDIMDSTTVTFDSYQKEDGSWKSEYIHAIPEGRTEKHVIDYRGGLTMDHLLTSMSSHLRHQPPSLRATTTITSINDVQTREEMRYYWDGFYLSNTPLREVLQAHRDYWHDGHGATLKAERPTDSVTNVTVPNLEVYIVNLYPTLEKEDYPKDPDGINNRVNDILYHDKTEYDEKVAAIVTDFIDLANELIKIAKANASDSASVQQAIDRLKADHTKASKKRNGKPRTFGNLLEGRFDVNKVVRIELSADTRNDIYGKAFEFSSETIESLLRRGYEDGVRAVATFGNNG